jgi:hypothetical protein
MIAVQIAVRSAGVELEGKALEDAIEFTHFIMYCNHPLPST